MRKITDVISSSAANRFALTSDLVIPSDAAAILQYDNTSQRWRLLASSAPPQRNTPNTFTRKQTIAGSQNEAQLDVKMDGSQTEPVVRVLTNSGQRLAFVNPGGRAFSSGTDDYRMQIDGNGLALWELAAISWTPSGPYNYDGDLFNVADTYLVRRAAAFPGPKGASGAGGGIEFLQVTSGGTPSTNSARIYSKDVSGTAEMFVMDEAGNETQISPHRMDGPGWLYDLDDPFPQVSYEAQHYLGVVRYVNRSRLDRLLAAGTARTSAPGLSTTFIHVESFEAFNARVRPTAPLEVLDWDREQMQRQVAYDQDREREQRVYERDICAEAQAIQVRRTKLTPAAGQQIQPSAEDLAAARLQVPCNVRKACDIRKPMPDWIKQRLTLQLSVRHAATVAYTHA